MERTIWDMVCPFCDRFMGMKKREATLNDRTGQHFIKARYNCPHCDFWLTTEIPRKIALQHERPERLPPPVEEVQEAAS